MLLTTGCCPFNLWPDMIHVTSTQRWHACLCNLVQNVFFCNESLLELSIHLHPHVRNVVVVAGCLVLVMYFRMRAWNEYPNALGYLDDPNSHRPIFISKGRLSLNCSFANAIYQITATLTHIGEMYDTHFFFFSVSL